MSDQFKALIINQEGDNFSREVKSIVTVSLEELIETYPKILKGEISGRVIVDLNK